MPQPQQPKRNKLTTTAWTGLWCDGEPGWRFSPYLFPNGYSTARDVTHPTHLGHFVPSVDDRFYKVEVTIKLLKDTRGRYIVRRGKRETFSARVGAVKP